MGKEVIKQNEDIQHNNSRNERDITWTLDVRDFPIERSHIDPFSDDEDSYGKEAEEPIYLHAVNGKIILLPNDNWITIFPEKKHETEAEEKRVEWSLRWKGYDPERQASIAALTSVGNGFFDRRLAIGSDTNPHPAAYLERVYGKSLEDPEKVGKTEPSKPEDLVNIPNWGIDVNTGGGWFNPAKAHEDRQLLDYEVELRMDTGTVYHHARFQEGIGENAKITTCIWEMRASKSQRNLSLDSLTVIPENWSGEVKIRTKIDAEVHNEGENLLQAVQTGVFGDTGIYTSAQIAGKDTAIALASNAEISVNGKKLKQTELERKIKRDEKKIYQEFIIQNEQGKMYRLDNRTILSHSNERSKAGSKETKKPLLKRTIGSATHARNTQESIRLHEAVWNEYWQQTRILIEGDPLLQKSVDYDLYQTGQRAIPEPHDRRPKEGQVPGGWGYRGHIFKNDSGNFAIDQFIYTQPEVAKGMLLHSYEGHKGFIQKAREKVHKDWEQIMEMLQYPEIRNSLFGTSIISNFSDYYNFYQTRFDNPGWFPYWEMASHEGGPATPDYVRNIKNPELIEKLELEEKKFHLTNDIPTAVLRYFEATGDQQFMEQYGYEMIVQGARFSAISAEFNETTGQYELKDKIGLDEYHESNPLTGKAFDNNAFQNYRAKIILGKAVAVLSENNELRKRLQVSDAELEYMQDVQQNIKINFDEETGIIPQHDGFFDHIHLPFRELFGNSTTVREDLQNPNYDKIVSSLGYKKAQDKLTEFGIMPATEEQLSGGELVLALFSAETIQELLQTGVYGKTLGELTHIITYSDVIIDYLDQKKRKKLSKRQISGAEEILKQGNLGQTEQNITQNLTAITRMKTIAAEKLILAVIGREEVDRLIKSGKYGNTEEDLSQSLRSVSITDAIKQPDTMILEKEEILNCLSPEIMKRILERGEIGGYTVQDREELGDVLQQINARYYRERDVKASSLADGTELLRKLQTLTPEEVQQQSNEIYREVFDVFGLDYLDIKGNTSHGLHMVAESQVYTIVRSAIVGANIKDGRLSLKNPKLFHNITAIEVPLHIQNQLVRVRIDKETGEWHIKPVRMQREKKLEVTYGNQTYEISKKRKIKIPLKTQDTIFVPHEQLK
jgi:trehalose/maltose hydrolase-like predicted phosphorylase